MDELVCKAIEVVANRNNRYIYSIAIISSIVSVVNLVILVFIVFTNAFNYK